MKLLHVLAIIFDSLQSLSKAEIETWLKSKETGCKLRAVYNGEVYTWVAVYSIENCVCR